MKLERVTFTGVDAKTDQERLFNIWRKFPNVEFGVLLSESRMGNDNRYPDFEVFKKIVAVVPIQHLSLHVCGKLSREAAEGKNSLEKFTRKFMDFNRIQFNNLDTENFTSKGFLDVVGRLSRSEIILPYNKKHELYVNEILKFSNINTVILRDASGGRGITSNWQPPLKVKTGYAGGLSPVNIIQKMKELEETLPKDYITWIDMENLVRTNDWFDLDKVESILRQLKKQEYI